MHSPKSYSIAFRLTNNKEQAEDIVQDCFLKLWIKPQKFDLSKNIKFSTWFYRVISNSAFDLKRKNSKSAKMPDELEVKDTAKKIEEVLDDASFQKILWTFINTLPERQQLALNLCFYEGFKNKEAAEIMEINTKALESLLMRAKTKLKYDFHKLSKQELKDHQYAK